MLSRVADSLYWMSRYLERAEHTARLLDVNLYSVLDATPHTAGRRWRRLAASLGMDPSSEDAGDARALAEYLTLDTGNSSSILSCITTARDNGRQAWEQISSEMWEQLNRLFLDTSRRAEGDLWAAEPHLLFTAVKEGSHLFAGITDSTMSHGEGWHFIQLGRNIERARATAALLDAYFSSAQHTPESLTDLEWVSLLKSCTAFEAYVKRYSATVEPNNVAAFLLLNSEFPRSIRFVAAGIRASLGAIGRMAGGHIGGRPDRLAGRLQAVLEYSQIEEIMGEDLHIYLDSIRRQCEAIHAAVYGAYIRYPVAAALAARDR